MKAAQLENQLEGSNIFYTSSIHLVSYLDSKGVRYVGINKFNDKNLFLFERNEELQNNMNAYHADKNLKSFLESFKKIKGVLSSSK